MRRKRKQRGSAMIEFTLVGIGSIFLLISTMEISRGMWNYHTLSYAVREGARYASVRGKGCTNTGNTCSATVGNVANQIAAAAIGVPAAQVNVTLTTDSGQATTCNPLSSCFADATVWPPASSNDNVPGKTLTVSARYTFQSALSMFWPGAGGVTFGTVVFPASSTQLIMF